jgi:hypothetical protein
MSSGAVPVLIIEVYGASVVQNKPDEIIKSGESPD